ncbi:hypothetical protein R3W88_023583 [Solanum pinnatisectum]|uniref:Uncharacterized protein n=1 Tax=Solanum pinnatisectum TaxID=50273 RepID=A0AAV9M160_9SOLN|nr:hypothetical protein R3W88_023583 [Solanum pinnatisectum]
MLIFTYVMAALIYGIWKARNGQERVQRTYMIMRERQESCKYRILEIVNRKINCKEKQWIEQIYKILEGDMDLTSNLSAGLVLLRVT